jgi:hypothetical protein
VLLYRVLQLSVEIPTFTIKPKGFTPFLFNNCSCFLFSAVACLLCHVYCLRNMLNLTHNKDCDHIFCNELFVIKHLCSMFNRKYFLRSRRCLKSSFDQAFREFRELLDRNRIFPQVDFWCLLNTIKHTLTVYTTSKTEVLSLQQPQEPLLNSQYYHQIPFNTTFRIINTFNSS